MSATVETLVEDIAALKVEVEVGPDVAKEEETSPSSTAVDPIAIARARAAAAMKVKKGGKKKKTGSGNAAIEAAKKAKGGGKKGSKKKMSTKEWNEKNYAAGHFAA